MPTLPPNPACIRPLHDAELERLKASHPDLPMSLGRCPTCRGAERFRWLHDGEPVEFDCDCAEQLMLHHWLLHCGVDRNYQRLGWDDVHVEQDALDEVLAYIDKIDARSDRGIGLVLHGTRGSGKSMLASLLLKRLIGQGFDGYFATFQSLLDLFASTWRADDEKAWFERRITNAGVLVIDDMGREYAGRLTIAGPLVDHVLRTRVAAQRPTIITSNKTLAEMGELYSLNALSLLQGCSIVVEFTGRDYRDDHLKRQLDEGDRGLTRPISL